MHRGIFIVTLSVLMSSPFLQPLLAGTIGLVDFQNYSQQFITGSFTDPTSGVLFSNAQHSGGVFGIQDSSNAHYAGAPTFLPTIYLTGNGLGSPNSGFSTNLNFGFDAMLPGSFQTVSFAILYTSTTGGTITLNGFDSSSQLVATATDNISPPNPTFAETKIAISAGTSSIAKITVRASGVSTGYDNIIFAVPEPSSLILLGLSGITLFGFCKRSRR